MRPSIDRTLLQAFAAVTPAGLSVAAAPSAVAATPSPSPSPTGDTAQLTVTPATSTGSFTANDVNPATGNASTLTVKDTIGHSNTVQADFDVVCLP